MKKYEVVYYPTENDVREMIELDCECFCGLDKGDLNKCLEWKNNCPDIYTAIKLDGRIIGYINFVAISKKCYYKIKAGNLKDYELKSGDILPFKRGVNYCLFMSVVIKKRYRDTDVVIELIKHFFTKIESLKQQGAVLDNVVCDCVSSEVEQKL